MFVLAKNKGGAWGLLQGQSENVRRPFFLLVSVAAIAFIVTLYRRLQPKQHALKWGLPLVLGGALGNVFDRIRYGFVIDFIDYRADWIKKLNELIQKKYPAHIVTDHWPTFNVADIAICVGVALMAIDMLTSRRGAKKPAARARRADRARRGRRSRPVEPAIPPTAPDPLTTTTEGDSKPRPRSAALPGHDARSVSELAGAEEALGEVGATEAARPLGEHDALEVLERALDVVVHDEVVEEAVVLDLDLRGLEAALHDLFGLARAPAEAALELDHRRRQDEHRDGVGCFARILACALVVDVEDHPGAARLRARALDLGVRRAVAVAVDLGPLDERLALDELVEVACARRSGSRGRRSRSSAACASCARR